MKLPYVITSTQASVVVSGQPYALSRVHPSFEAFVEAIKAGDVNRIAIIVDQAKAIRSRSAA